MKRVFWLECNNICIVLTITGCPVACLSSLYESLHPIDCQVFRNESGQQLTRIPKFYQTELRGCLYWFRLYLPLLPLFEFVCAYEHMYVCMYVCVCMYVWMYACMYVCMYVCVCVCVWMYVYVCMYVCTYIREKLVVSYHEIHICCGQGCNEIQKQTWSFNISIAMQLFVTLRTVQAFYLKRNPRYSSIC
jgi:hypothetical protein